MSDLSRQKTETSKKCAGRRRMERRGAVAGDRPVAVLSRAPRGAVALSLPVLILASQGAYAACTSLGGGAYNCATSETTQQSLSASGVPLSVTVNPGLTFTVPQTNRSAFILNGNAGISFSQAAGGGAISGGNSGIRATNTTGGAVSITATGDVNGTTGAGVFAVTSGNGLSINVGNASGRVHGVNANSDGTGNVSVVSTGTTSATVGSGISANLVTNGTNLSIDAVNAFGNQQGINATHTGIGSTRITATGSVTASAGNGILSSAGSTTTSTTITANDVTGSVNGVSVAHAGSGALAVTANGDITGGTGAGILNQAGSKGGTFTIASGASLQATSGVALDDAADGSAGNAASTLDVSGALNGDALMGSGADQTIIRSGASLGAGILLDGDNGAGSFIVGQIDRLEFTDWTGSIDAGQIANQEEVVLSGASTVTFDNALAPGAGLANANLTDGLSLQLGGGAVARFSSDLAVNGSLVNLGRLDLSTAHGTAGTALSVTGNYTGGGQLLLDVDFATNTADQLLVGGNVMGGQTLVYLNDLSTGLATGTDILFADITGTTALGDFALAGGPISSGAYNYDVKLAGTQWFLGAVTTPVGPGPAVNTVGAVYESTPAVLLGAFGSLPSYRQRLDQRQWLTGGPEVTRGDGSGGAGRGFWLRVVGTWSDIAPKGSSAGADYDSSAFTTQIGSDLHSVRSAGGAWIFGVSGQFGRVDADVTNAMGAGKIRADGYGLGASATWIGDGGSYLDAQGQVNWLSADMSTVAQGQLVNGAGMTAYSIGIEAGHRFQLAGGHALVPQAHLTFSRLDGGNLTDSLGNPVSFGSAESQIGRIGIGYEYKSAGAAERRSFYATGNILHEFGGGNAVNLMGTTLSAGDAGTWGEVAIGGSIDWGQGQSLYAEGSYRRSFDGGSSADSAATLSIGYSRSF